MHGRVLTPGALVVDVGFGASPVTTVELFSRLRARCSQVSVVGLDIDAARVAAAQAVAQPGLEFRRGGFELAGLRPTVVRAFNVLRQYDEESAAGAWESMRAQLRPGGLLVEGTCDEVGRRASWVTLDADGPQTLTLAVHLPTLERPGVLAERLPKALIHRNVAGEPVHALLAALDAAWDRAAPHAAFGQRQRWVAAIRALDWEHDGRRARYGEITVPWATLQS